ncbi:MAG: hypothetical protein HC862_26645 [Scytonema sp. RU_4_4]|nr:hypothetical protein [Scytonema sp. RU_4_4]NJR74126.1 hypothetical protein [Scytonema sp. CRU_2_7]
MKKNHISRGLIPTYIFFLLSIYALLTYSESYAENVIVKPVKAVVTKLGNGKLVLLDRSNKESSNFTGPERSRTLEPKGKGLVVPPKAPSGSSEGYTMANIEFKDKTEKTIPKPIAHVRPTSYKAIYWFPCRAAAGEFIFAWLEVQNADTNKKPFCPQIDVGTGRINLNSQFDQTQSNYASKMTKGFLKTITDSFPRYSQNLTSPSRIFISPVGNGTIIVDVSSSEDNITVNALVGDVTIQSAEQPNGFILQQGLSYSSSSGRTQNINPADIPRSSIEAFLNPNNWSQSVAAQIQELQKEPNLAQWQNQPTPRREVPR